MQYSRYAEHQGAWHTYDALEEVWCNTAGTYVSTVWATIFYDCPPQQQFLTNALQYADALQHTDAILILLH